MNTQFDSDDSESLFGKYPGVTEHAVQELLDRYELKLVPGRDAKWLVKVVKVAFYTSEPDSRSDPEREANTETKEKLEALSEKILETWHEFCGLGHDADYYLLDFAFRSREAEDERLRNFDPELRSRIDTDLAEYPFDPEEYRRLRATMADFPWLGGFFKRAADELTADPHKWQNTSAMKLRIDRARFLAPVFEAAFGNDVSVKDRTSPTLWMNFYQDMMGLALNEPGVSNLIKVLKDAGKMHKDDPVEYGGPAKALFN